MAFLRWFGSKLSIVATCTFILFSYSNCGLVEQPRLTEDSLSSLGNFNHLGIGDNCMVCHGSGESFDAFPKSGHIDTQGQDCAACHTFSSWRTGAGYSHDPVPASCTECHSNKMPATRFGKMDHNFTATTDCKQCHLAHVGQSWVDGVFSHTPRPTQCQNCHSQQRPTTVVGTPPFNHSTSGLGDCLGCHGQNAGTTWVTAQFSHTPIPTSCNSCHVGDRPNNVINKMDHSLALGTDCVSCHISVPANVGVTWAGGRMPHSPTPTSCYSCHSGQVPAGTVPNTRSGFNHNPTYGTECKTCHTVVPGNIGVSWTKGFFNHNNNNAGSFTNCAPCHSTREHHANEKCTNCHKNIRWPTPNSNGNYGGSWGDG